jgi:hypothetical protein
LGLNFRDQIVEFNIITERLKKSFKKSKHPNITSTLADYGTLWHGFVIYWLYLNANTLSRVGWIK